MTIKEVEEKVIELVCRQPFIPFVVEMTDGTHLEVPHPRLALDEKWCRIFWARRRTSGLRTQNGAWYSFRRRERNRMIKDQFDTAYRAFCRRRPFRKFLIEFTSGHQVQVRHQEVVRDEGIF